MTVLLPGEKRMINLLEVKVFDADAAVVEAHGQQVESLGLSDSGGRLDMQARLERMPGGTGRALPARCPAHFAHSAHPQCARDRSLALAPAC